MDDKVLSAEELEQFARRGYVRVTDALAPEFVARNLDYVWSKFQAEGVLRDNPATWSLREWIAINKEGLDKTVRPEITPRLAAVANQLLGAGMWRPLKTLGGLLMTLPKDPPPTWDITTRMWHSDNDARSYQNGMDDLMLFTFYSPVAPQGGGTLILAGSHHLQQRYLAECSVAGRELRDTLNTWQPYLAELTGAAPRTRTQSDFMDRETDVCGVPVQVVELTGDPGDAIVCHPAILHATSINSLPAPRIMRRTNFRRKRRS